MGSFLLQALINDVVVGFPIGISSLAYLLICGFSAYLRNITLRPNLFKDWMFFLFTILVINSLTYSLLTLFFSFEINYMSLMSKFNFYIFIISCVLHIYFNFINKKFLKVVMFSSVGDTSIKKLNIP